MQPVLIESSTHVATRSVPDDRPTPSGSGDTALLSRGVEPKSESKLSRADSVSTHFYRKSVFASFGHSRAIGCVPY